MRNFKTALILTIGVLLSNTTAIAAGCCGTVFDPQNFQENQMSANRLQEGNNLLSRGVSTDEQILRAIGRSGGGQSGGITGLGPMSLSSQPLYGSAGSQSLFGSDYDGARSSFQTVLTGAQYVARLAVAADSLKRGYGQSIGLVGLTPQFRYLASNLVPQQNEFTTVESAKGWSRRTFYDDRLDHATSNNQALSYPEVAKYQQRRQREETAAALDLQGVSNYNLRAADETVSRVARYKGLMEDAAEDSLRKQVVVLSMQMTALIEEIAGLRGQMASMGREQAASTLARVRVQQIAGSDDDSIYGAPNAPK